MKKLDKLQINSEKLMKNEELLILRGGYDGGANCGLTCSSDTTCGSYSGNCTLCRAHPWRPEYWCVGNGT